MNNVTIVGNLTADPELKFIHNGAAVVNFTIANTPRTFNKQKNEWEDGETTYLRASAWRDMAEHITESLAKGSRVIATGKLAQKSYEKDGQKKSYFELEVEEIGPSLKYAKAAVYKTTKSVAEAVADPWGKNDSPVSF